MTWLQRWIDVLFLHFAVAADELEPHLPPQVEIDTFDGQAWLSFIFFRLKLRPAGLPFVPGLSSLLEMNVRTYVKHRDQRGIYFLRMYADNRLAILAARWLTPLCYEHARMVDRRLSDGCRHIECSPARNPGCGLSLDFQFTDDPSEPSPNSLAFWLVERYRLFVARGDGSILAGDVEHSRWRVSAAEIVCKQNNLGEALNMSLDNSSSLAHYSRGLSAKFNRFGPTLAFAKSTIEYKRLHDATTA